MTARRLIESLTPAEHALAVTPRVQHFIAQLGVRYDPVARTFIDRAKDEYLDASGWHPRRPWDRLEAVEPAKLKLYQACYDAARELMTMNELEPTSALKQAAADHGIAYGDEMLQFVDWAFTQLES